MDFYYYSTILGSEWLTACLRSTTWSVFVRLPSPAVARSLSGMDIRDMYEPLVRTSTEEAQERTSAIHHAHSNELRSVLLLDLILEEGPSRGQGARTEGRVPQRQPTAQ